MDYSQRSVFPPDPESDPSAAALRSVFPPDHELDPSAAAVVDREIDERTPALLGLARFVTAFRLAWNEETLDDKTQTDTVIKHLASPRGATYRAGFRTPEDLKERPEDRTIKPVETLTAWWRERQDKARRVAWYELYSLERTGPYAVKKDISEIEPDALPIDEMEFRNPTARRAEESRRKVRIMDAGKNTTLGTPEHIQRIKGVRDDRGNLIVRPERMQRRTRKQHLKDIAEQKHLRHIIHEVDEKFQRAAEGDTPYGNLRRKKIEKTTRKVDELTRKRDELRLRASS